MTEKLIIQHFGPIINANLELKRYMLFIGSQASGKSTIAKLIAIFRDAEFVVRQDESNRLFKNYGIDSYFFNGNTFLSYQCDNYSIKYENSNWKFDISTAFEQKINLEDERIKGIITNYVNSNDRHDKKSEEEKSQLINSFYDNGWSNFFSLLKKQVYIPAERIIVTSINQRPFLFGFGNDNPSLASCLKEFGTRFDFAKEDLKELPIDFLNITYKNENGENRIYINENKSILLSESASGFQAIIPMLVVFNHLISGNNDFIVEEPEMNLFPTVQKDLVNFLISHSNTSDVKSSLVVTTHSPYILTILNNLLFAYKTSKEHSTKEEDIKLIVSKDKWINPEEFNAYYLSNGTSLSIFDRENGLMTHNELDSISQNLAGERDALLELY